VRGKILLFSVLLLVAMGVASLALLVPFTTNSTVAGYEYRVNTLRANWYLMANGYGKKYDGVKISLVDEVQNSYQHTGKDGMVFQSFSAVREGETLVMKVQYDPVQRENYAKGKGSGSYSRDLYMYLCLSMQGGNPKASDCYKRADLQMARERWLPGKAVDVVRQGAVGWRLVGRVQAQACAGTIPCGMTTLAGYCSNDSTISCTDNKPCGSFNTCIGGGQERCDPSLGQSLNCSSLTTKAQCETQGYTSNCAAGCYVSSENYCSWGGTGGGACPAECRQGSSCGAGYSSTAHLTKFEKKPIMPTVYTMSIMQFGG
jgi:ribosomal protein L25 (general stress protein Ctc)